MSGRVESSDAEEGGTPHGLGRKAWKAVGSRAASCHGVEEGWTGCVKRLSLRQSLNRASSDAALFGQLLRTKDEIERTIGEDYSRLSCHDTPNRSSIQANRELKS